MKKGIGEMNGIKEDFGIQKLSYKEKIMSTLIQVLTALYKFSKSEYNFYRGANLESVTELEKKLNFELPSDFKEFLLFSDGADILGESVYGVRKHRNLIDIYSNYLIEKDKVGNPIAEYLLPITPNGRGDHYCLDLNSLSESKDRCNIVFWQHDYDYDEYDRPRLEAISFYDYLMNMMSDYLEYFNYDGSEK